MRPLRIRIQQAARASITSAIFPTAGVSSTIRAGCCTCSSKTTSPSSTRTSGRSIRTAPIPRWRGGFTGFAFHPEFARNGLLYTMHIERATGDVAAALHPARIHACGRDSPQRPDRVARDEPCGEHIRGHPARTAACRPRGQRPHPSVRHLEFNPRSKPGDPDYGLIYTSGSDVGFSNGAGAEREKSQPATASGYAHRRDLANRSAESFRIRRD